LKLDSAIETRGNKQEKVGHKLMQQQRKENRVPKAGQNINWIVADSIFRGKQGPK